MIDLFERLNWGIGVDVDGDFMWWFDLFILLYFEVDVVETFLNLYESVQTFMIAFDMLSIVVFIADELLSDLFAFLFRHEVFYVGVSGGWFAFF